MSTNEIHTMPISDLIDHEASETCWCGPTCFPVQHDDGTIGWLYQHHSLDGREHNDPDHDKAECVYCRNQ